MKSPLQFKLLCARIAIALAILFITISASAQTSTFTYQGRLTDSGAPANGNYDLQFALWDSTSAGSQIGSTQTINTVAIVNGVFSVSLDFGAGSFNGANRFLEIGARPSGGGSFTILSPRQQVTATPYAIRSANASSADTATTATNATQLGGVAAAQYVQTNDSRLTDARTPTAGSSNYIQNTTSQQASNFNISGNGTVGGTLSGNVVDVTQLNINGQRTLTTSATENLFVGLAAGNTATTGNANSVFGTNAGQKITSGVQNSFFGHSAGNSTQTGFGNSFFGWESGFSNSTGKFNSYFGQETGRDTNGDNNAFFGFETAFSAHGNNNSAFGPFAGAFLSGDNNTLLGFATSADGGLTNATAIGSCARVTKSNSVVLGSIANLAGGCATPPAADTNVGIGTTTPSKRLEVGTSTVGDGINLFGTAPAFLLSNGGNSEKGSLGFASSAGLYSTDALAGDVVLRATTNRLILQHGTGGAALILNAAGNVQVQNLAAGGGTTQLCRNGSNEITSCNSSSLRYKTNVANFSGGMNIINRLRPISFTWKTDGVKDIGFGAEEVEKVAPLFTFRNDKGQIEGVRYDRLGVLFVNAFKEQQVLIQQQQEQIKQQQAAMDELNARLQKVERALKEQASHKRQY